MQRKPLPFLRQKQLDGALWSEQSVHGPGRGPGGREPGRWPGGRQALGDERGRRARTTSPSSSGMLVVSMPDGVAEPFAYDEERTVLLMDSWHQSVYEQAVGLASDPLDFVSADHGRPRDVKLLLASSLLPAAPGLRAPCRRCSLPCRGGPTAAPRWQPNVGQL